MGVGCVILYMVKQIQYDESNTTNDIPEYSEPYDNTVSNRVDSVRRVYNRYIKPAGYAVGLLTYAFVGLLLYLCFVLASMFVASLLLVLVVGFAVENPFLFIPCFLLFIVISMVLGLYREHKRLE